MPTTQNDIRRWIAEAKAQHATHMLVVCDTFDHGDYPVYVLPGVGGKTVREVYAECHGKNMQRVMEVYSMSRDIESQLAEHRAFHFDDATPAPPVQSPSRRGFLKAVAGASSLVAGLSAAKGADGTAAPPVPPVPPESFSVPKSLGIRSDPEESIQFAQGSIGFRVGHLEEGVAEFALNFADLPDGPIEATFSGVFNGRGRVRMLLSEMPFQRKRGGLRKRKLRLLDGTEQIMNAPLAREDEAALKGGPEDTKEFLLTVRGRPFANPGRHMCLLVLCQGEPALEGRAWTIQVRETDRPLLRVV